MDELVTGEQANVGMLLEEFKSSGGMDFGSVQRERSRRLRFCQWPGRSSDYRKHRKALGRDPNPWEDAFDYRPYLVDDIISEVGDAVANGFKRAELTCRPTGAEDIARAGIVSAVLLKYKERMPELADEAEFMWNWSAQDGKAIWQVSWEKEVAMKRVPITLEQLHQAAAAAAQALSQVPEELHGQLDPEVWRRASELIELPLLIQDPALEDQAVAAVQTFAQQIAGQLFAPQREEYGEDFLANYEIGKARARAVVRELRKTGKSELAGPYLTRNGPCVTARRVGYDVFISAGCPSDLQRARAIQVREWLGEAELREAQAVYGWDREWVELVLAKAKGKTSIWGDVELQSEYAVDEEDETVPEHLTLDTKLNEVEVVHGFVKKVNEEGVPEVWCTVYCPHVMADDAGAEIFAKHYRQDYATNRYCFEPYRQENISRNFYESRGIPELAGCDQAALKKNVDALLDRADAEVNPPWQVHNRLGLRYKAGPGSQVPFARKGDIEPMPPPSGSPQLAFNLIELSMRRVSNRWGLMNEYVLPAKWQMKLTRQVDRFLTSAGCMMKLVLRLVQENASPEELERITAGGSQSGLASGAASQGGVTLEEIAGEYDVTLYFDVKDLDMEFVFKKLEGINKLAVPMDRAGMIDMAALTRLVMLAIDPTYARALITDQRTASQKLFNEVKSELALMYVGNEPDLVEMDPTAEDKLKFAQQIIFGDADGGGANLEYLEALGKLPNGDPAKRKERFGALLEKWQKNLMQSVKQDRNKEIGRLGVKREDY